MDWIERRIRKERGYTIQLISEISDYLNCMNDPRLTSFNRNPVAHLRKYYGVLGDLLDFIWDTGAAKCKKKIHLR